MHQVQVQEKDLESFDACLDTLKQQGYNIKETQHVRVNDPRGGSAKQRGDELNQLFQDPEVDFVMCAKGGDFLNEMIPYISFETLKKHPKFIMGASDPTGVLYPYTTLCDVATIYGFNGGSSYDLRPLPQFVKTTSKSSKEISLNRQTIQNIRKHCHGMLKDLFQIQKYNGIAHKKNSQHLADVLVDALMY